VSAEIIQFICPNRKSERTDFPTIVFRPMARSDDLTMGHADTAPCEYVWPETPLVESGDA
jgi:hypothetical protein